MATTAPMIADSPPTAALEQSGAELSPAINLGAGETSLIAQALVTITGLPRSYRRTVENLIVDTLGEEPPAMDPLDSAITALSPEADGHNLLAVETVWFTRWRREDQGTIGCQEIMCATRQALRHLADELRENTKNTSARTVVRYL